MNITNFFLQLEICPENDRPFEGFSKTYPFEIYQGSKFPLKYFREFNNSLK